MQTSFIARTPEGIEAIRTLGYLHRWKDFMFIIHKPIGNELNCWRVSEIISGRLMPLMSNTLIKTRHDAIHEFDKVIKYYGADVITDVIQKYQVDPGAAPGSSRVRQVSRFPGKKVKKR
jgi:hypothetical protein